MTFSYVLADVAVQVVDPTKPSLQMGPVRNDRLTSTLDEYGCRLSNVADAVFDRKVDICAYRGEELQYMQTK